LTHGQLTLRLVCLSAHTQTVPDLKELCARLELPMAGTKQDLIDRLARHPGGGFDGGGGAGAGAVSKDGGGGGGGNGKGGGAVRRDRHGRFLCLHNRRKDQCKQCGGS
jgi:hypothetical protein